MQGITQPRKKSKVTHYFSLHFLQQNREKTLLTHIHREVKTNSESRRPWHLPECATTLFSWHKQQKSAHRHKNSILNVPVKGGWGDIYYVQADIHTHTHTHTPKDTCMHKLAGSLERKKERYFVESLLRTMSSRPLLYIGVDGGMKWRGLNKYRHDRNHCRGIWGKEGWRHWELASLLQNNPASRAPKTSRYGTTHTHLGAINKYTFTRTFCGQRLQTCVLHSAHIRSVYASVHHSWKQAEAKTNKWRNVEWQTNVSIILGDDYTWCKYLEHKVRKRKVLCTWAYINSVQWCTTRENIPLGFTFGCVSAIKKKDRFTRHSCYTLKLEHRNILVLHLYLMKWKKVIIVNVTDVYLRYSA